MLLDVGLPEDRAFRRIEPDAQPLRHHGPGAFLDAVRGLIVRGQRMPVGDKEETAIVLLQSGPVAQCPVEMSQMKKSGGARPAYNDFHGFSLHDSDDDDQKPEHDVHDRHQRVRQHA